MAGFLTPPLNYNQIIGAPCDGLCWMYVVYSVLVGDGGVGSVPIDQGNKRSEG